MSIFCTLSRRAYASKRLLPCSRFFSSPPPTAANKIVPPVESKLAKMNSRTPITWGSLFLASVAAASAVAYYRIERERRLEQAVGQVVSSEFINENNSSSSSDNNSDSNGSNYKASEGWTPSPGILAKRKFVSTKYGWYPIIDSFGASGKPALGGNWSLVDLDGNLVTNRSFEGKWTLLYFGFARCPDICPSEMMKVGQVMDTLKADHPEIYEKVVPLFVSIDPARDSLKALKSFAADFHPRYVFMTGSPSQVLAMAKLYRVYVSKADETADGDYLVDHSIVIYFHDDQGELADVFTQSMRPSDLVQKIVKHAS